MRGKNSQASAQRRAQSAEEQLDRLLPKLVDTERLLKQYRADAEETIRLRRVVAELREQNGIPRAEHEAKVAELEDEVQATADVYDFALRELWYIIEPLLRAPMPDLDFNIAVSNVLSLFPHDLSRQIAARLYPGAREVTRRLSREDATEWFRTAIKRQFNRDPRLTRVEAKRNVSEGSSQDWANAGLARKFQQEHQAEEQPD